MKNFLKKIYLMLLGFYKSILLKNYIKKNYKIKIVVGASKTYYKTWFSTEHYFLDVTNELDFKKFFNKKKIDNILSEHVFEHLTSEQTFMAVANLRNFIKDGGIIRIAVPDGFHKDESYINLVKPNGSGKGSFDHKVLYNYKTLTKIFSDNGFDFNLIEYWDENKIFHSSYSDENGYIKRSLKNDSRNISGNPIFTSLVIDFYK